MDASRFWNMRLVAVAALMAALLPLGCSSDAATDEDESGDEGTVAYAVGDPISDSTYAVIVDSEYGSDTLATTDFRQRMNSIVQQAPTMGLDPSQQGELRRVLVESFVEQHVITGETDAAGLAADTAAVGQQMRQARSQFETEEQFQEALTQQGLTEDSLRQVFGQRSRQQQLQQQLADEAEEPSEEEMNAFREERAQQVGAQHILFLVDQGAPAAAEDSVRQLAVAVLDSIEADQVSFSEAAQRHSGDGSASQGGDLGYFSRGQMVPPFEEAAFALSDSGDVTEEPVRTRFGFHLIRKTGEQEGQMMDSTRARQMMMNERQRGAFQSGMDRLRARATVRINPDVVEGVDLSEPFDLLEQRRRGR